MIFYKTVPEGREEVYFQPLAQSKVNWYPERGNNLAHFVS